MKKYVVFFLFSFYILMVVDAAIKDSLKASVRVLIHNTESFARKDYPVVIPISNFEKIIKNFDAKSLAVFEKGKEISIQVDDLNADGKADELVFLIDMKPNQTKKLVIKQIPLTKKRKIFPKEVHAQLLLKTDSALVPLTEVSSTKDDMYNKLQHHGVAFESALIGYRVYFDNKQTVDVYGKKKRQLELAETLWYPTDEQLAKAYGDDILRVSGSVGIGAIKGWDGKKAAHITNYSKRTQRIVAQGNLRTVVDVVVSDWKYEKKTFGMKARYILYARHRDVEVNIVFSPELKEEITLATGVQKLPDNQVFTDNEGLIGVWGTDFPVNDTVKYAKQTVGLGVVVPLQYVKQQLTDKVNNLVLLKNNEGRFIKYSFTAAAMKEEKGYKTANDFFAYMLHWKKDVLNPLLIKIE